MLYRNDVNPNREGGKAQKNQFKTKPGGIVGNGKREEVAGVQGLERVDGELAIRGPKALYPVF